MWKQMCREGKWSVELSLKWIAILKEETPNR